ncbi:hypothetical protein NX722_19945 [Endozoicomonas gorgoniicola]|uniref:Uncharacterized protein n=1 Tax=Endozoicomonas gorgoniicola TaxID=1234144 RepID=A0ABT3MZQ7_9GAMM|nr:hypothetical protein [Endozoicomonas gorgoniicola]MCW7554847.1 hypothetical protein [Endozoicomonas gorgoniicola]
MSLPVSNPVSNPVSIHTASNFSNFTEVSASDPKPESENQWGTRKIGKSHSSKITDKKSAAVNGKSFFDMSITERLVFALSLFSGLQGAFAQNSGKSDSHSMIYPTKPELSTCPKTDFSDWITTLDQKNSKRSYAQAECLTDQCSAPEVTTKKEISPSKKESQLPSCQKPDLMEQIGPVDKMTGVYKKSDETSITLGIKHPETVPVMRKYKDLANLESKAMQLTQTLEQINNYIIQNNYDFRMLTYNEKQHIMQNTFRIRPLTPCMKGLIDELDSYDTALKEIFMYQKESGDYQAYAEELKALTEGRKAIIVSLLKSLKAELQGIDNYTSAVFKEQHDKVERNFQKNKKYISSQLKKSEAILSSKEINKMMQQCLKDQRKCINEQKIAEAKDIADRVRAQREANKNSFGMKLLNLFSATYLASFIGLVTSSLAMICLPKKVTRYFTSIKKINTRRILEQRIKDKKVVLPKNIKQSMDRCDSAEEKIRSSQTSSKLNPFPEGWEQVTLSKYHDVTQLKKEKRDKRSQRTMTETLKDIVMPEESKMPEMPWKTDISINHQFIKPVYRRGFVPSDKETNKKNIVAYAFFDPSSDGVKNSISDDGIKKMQSIHEAGRYAPHEKSATGYKCFKHKSSLLWEFKVAGDERLYGVTIPANDEGKKAGVAPLVVFDTILSEKL